MRTQSPRRHGFKSSFPRLMLAALCALLAVSRLPSAAASQGDRSPEYQQCVESCVKDQCSSNPNWDDGMAATTHLPFILQATGWTCQDDCRYHCTHRVTNDANDRVKHIREEAEAAVRALAAASEQDGSQGRGGMSRAAQAAKVEELVQSRLAQLRPVQKQMVQYHGKWVFIRVLGAQEPLSVLFSLLNLRVHALAVMRLRAELPELFPLKVIYVLHALVSCNAWIWSAIFHARDKPFTERLDYFSAGAAVLSGFFFSLCRLFRWGPSHPRFTLLARGCGAALVLHVLYLSIGRFDYSYNMTANVLVGALHSLLWLVYSFNPAVFAARPAGNVRPLSRRIDERPPNQIGGGGSPPMPVISAGAAAPTSRAARRKLQLIVGLLVLATSLELFDFPPLMRALDAHALWHLATVPIASMWYDWLIDDARECVSSGWWAGEGLRDPALDVAPHVAVAIERARQYAVQTTQSGHAVGVQLVNRLAALRTNSEREVEKAKELHVRSGSGVV